MPGPQHEHRPLALSTLVVIPLLSVPVNRAEAINHYVSFCSTVQGSRMFLQEVVSLNSFQILISMNRRYQGESVSSISEEREGHCSSHSKHKWAEPWQTGWRFWFQTVSFYGGSARLSVLLFIKCKILAFNKYLGGERMKRWVRHRIAFGLFVIQWSSLRLGVRITGIYMDTLVPL